MTGFKKWPSIGRFSDIYHLAQKNDIDNVTFRGKIKLHGTNAAIRVVGSTVTGQKRTSDVTVQHDNAHFAGWLESVKLAPTAITNGIFYGEWAGPGVQAGDAVAQLDNRKLFVFAYYDLATNTAEFEPTKLAELVSTTFVGTHDIYVLPWYTDAICVNFFDQENAQSFITNMTTLVDYIANEDPYIKDTFGVSGSGEGIVFYSSDFPELWNEWMFKVKSESHSVNNSKKRDHVAAEKPAGIDDFMDMFFTENRFKQILHDNMNDVIDRKNTGEFLKAVMTDVHKESHNELALAEFEWKQVTKYGALKTKSWFFAKADELT